MQCIPPAVNPEFADAFSDEQDAFHDYSFQPTMQSFGQQVSYDDFFLQQHHPQPTYQSDFELRRMHSGDYGVPATHGNNGTVYRTLSQPGMQIPTPVSDFTPSRQATTSSSLAAQASNGVIGGYGCPPDAVDSELTDQMGDLKISGTGHGGSRLELGIRR